MAPSMSDDEARNLTDVNPQLLLCPLCSEPFSLLTRQLVCPSNHSFDVARQGYVNLLPVQQKRSRHPGDSKEMVAARTQFLNTGIYEPIAQKVTELVRPLLQQDRPLRLLDAGCGEGYYLDYLIQALLPLGKLDAVGMDISKEAVAAAAKRSKDITWIVGTNARPPLAPGLDLILSIFGFPSYEGFRPLLKPGGRVLLVEPGPDHLIELRQVIYPRVKRNPPPGLAKAEELGFQLADSQSLQYQTRELDQEAIQDLLQMTPHLYRAKREGKEAAARLTSIQLTVDVVFRTLEYQA